MCRSLVSVGYDGKLYDCDVNQMLKMPIYPKGSTRPLNIWEVYDLAELNGLEVGWKRR